MSILLLANGVKTQRRLSGFDLGLFFSSSKFDEQKSLCLKFRGPGWLAVCLYGCGNGS